VPKSAVVVTVPGEIHRFPRYPAKKAGFNDAEDVLANTIRENIYGIFPKPISVEYTILCCIDIIPFLDGYLGVVTTVYSNWGMMSLRHFNKFALL